MKRFLILILILFLSVNVFAFSDYFSYLGKNPAYNNLIRALKDSKPEDEVEALYQEYIKSTDSITDITRMDCQMVRYFSDNKNNEKAERYYLSGKKNLDKIKNDFEYQITKTDIANAEYTVYEKTKMGIESSNLIKKLYKNYPDEVSAYILEANRILYTPHIAGGSPKRAVEYFKVLEQSGFELLPVDQYTLFAGLGIGYHKRNDKEKAKKYLVSAVKMFSGDPILNSILKENYNYTSEAL